MGDERVSSPPRVSRYRSQRQAQPPPDDPAPELPQDDGVVRSKSRYHRKPGPEGRQATSHDSDRIDISPRARTRPLSPPSQNSPSPPHHPSQSPFTQQSHTVENRRRPARYASPPTESGVPDLRRVRSEEMESGLEQQRLERLNRNSEKRLPAPIPISPLPSLAVHPHLPLQSSPPSGQLFPPPAPYVLPPAQALRLDGPPSSGQIRATKSTSELPTFADNEAPGGCFGLFKRKRGEAAPQIITEKEPIARPTTSKHEAPVIKPGGGGIVPGTDAPISAVNAGDRRVLVECGKSKSIFPVTPTTTPVDLIKSSATCMSERIDVHSAVILEYFGTVGVQRPLRRYEHVRDVMNSWDTDRQNSLRLIDPGNGSSEAELSIAGVPERKPESASWQLFYSQRVGKWERRYITLKDDGQITSQKDPSKPKQQENVCHLSDFDIYTPTQDKMRKKIKPPKKLCYAIKSQQKTIMFESEQNFVHFFSTGDRSVADSFYRAVQGWRSWYLVNVMGEGKKPESVPDAASPERGRQVSGNMSKGHRKQESFSSHYQLGSFQALMAPEAFEKSIEAIDSPTGPPPWSNRPAKTGNQLDTSLSPERKNTASRKQYPPGAMTTKAQLAEDEPLANLGRRASLDRRRPSMDGSRAAPGEFVASGLLGRSYSQRQREHLERENVRAQPWTTGPNLLNGAAERADSNALHKSMDGPRRNPSTHARTSDLRRNQSTRDGHGSADLGRSNSRVREKPKPLIDLTPEYREPPQHARKGKGHHPDQIGPGGLINSATSPDDPLGIPPSTDWQNRNAQQQQQQQQQQQDVRNRSRSLSRPGQQPTSYGVSDPGASGAFTGEGLLAGGFGQQGWGGGDRGRGVMDGSHARGPMLDMHEPSKFVQGSLLNMVEREQGRPGPVIDREQ